MRLLPGALDELLRFGQITVATPSGAASPLLVTRVALSGDVLVQVARHFAASPDAAVALLHAGRVRSRLDELRRIEPLLCVTSIVLGHLGSALPLAGAAGAVTQYADWLLAQVPPFLAAMPIMGTILPWLLGLGALVLHAALQRRLRRLAGTMLAARLRRRMADFARAVAGDAR